MTFGDNREHDENGWIIYPRDVTYRAQYFVNWKDAGLPGDHPAKANLHLTEDLINYVTEPGERVMDINGGSGSILIGVTTGRLVTSFEIAPHFINWQRLSLDKMIASGDAEIETGHMILEGNCQKYLPIPASAIVFSPPYSKAMNADTKSGVYKDQPELAAAIEGYRYGGNENIGNLDNFLYNRRMKEIYKLCFDSLSSGGKICILIKDRISAGKRIDLGRPAVNMMGSVGFQMFEWVRWLTPGSSFANIHKSKGRRIVEDEHIIIMEKP